MIATSRSGKILAFLLAGGAHAALAVGLSGQVKVEMEGASGGAEVRLGSSFADMAMGSVPAQGAETAEAADPPPVDLAEAPDPDAAAERPEPEAVERPEPEAVKKPEPELAEPVPQRRPADSPAPTEMAALAVPVAAVAVTAAPAVVPVTRAEPVPVQPVAMPAAPAPAPMAAKPEPAEVLEADTPDSAAVTRSKRPQTRSRAFEQAHRPAPEPKPAPKRKIAEKPEPKAKPKPRAVPQGNAERNARAGAATGNAQAKAKAAGSGGKKRAAGNAAVSNYPGQVMRKISRVRRPNVGSRGTAVVAFRIAANGGLAGASISRSSGSSALDRAALQVIRRAAPFPKPPSGARRSFSIKIKGR